MDFSHKSVLLSETIDNLSIKPQGIYVDGTLGGGGHAFHVCEKLSSKGRLIGIDQDEAAIEAASERLACFRDRVTIVRSNYEAMPEVLEQLGLEVCSKHFDASELGSELKKYDAVVVRSATKITKEVIDECLIEIEEEDF